MNFLNSNALHVLLDKLDPPEYYFNEHSPKLLLVDDEPRLLSSLVELLKDFDYQLVTATNGMEAIDHLSKSSFNVVLLDLLMPKKSGHDVLDYIKKSNSDVDVIILSGCTDFERAISLLEHKISGYLLKPYQPEELFNTIENTLAQQRLAFKNRHESWLLESSETFYRFLINSLPDFIFILNAEGTFVFVNEHVHQLLGYNPGELIGKHFTQIVHEEDLQQASFVFIERRNGERASDNVQFRVKYSPSSQNLNNPKPHILYISCSSIGIYSKQQEIRKYVGTYGIIRNITEHKEAEKLAIFQANHDLLTGLPNRHLLRKKFNLLLTQSKKDCKRIILMFIDLDRFKLINDAYGHSKGDELLCIVTKRMLEKIEPSDTLARIGGDEFVLLLSERTDQFDILLFAENFLNNLTEPLYLGNKEVRISASIGIGFYPKDGKTLDKLISNADMAMYQVKSTGRNGYSFYENSMLNEASRKMIINQELSNALDKGEFEMYFQPLVNAINNQIIGAEGLIRWNHPKKGLLSASEFIGHTEDTGLVPKISEWTIDTICKTLHHWNTMGYALKQISINLSPTYLERYDFSEKIQETLNYYQIMPSQIEIEILENINISNMEHVISQLHKLNQLGVKIAIDDFGTGYSSLNYLERFPVDTIKLDQIFIKEIKEKSIKSPIISAIISIAQGLDLNLIAEGVETEFQSNYLQNLGCFLMQGFFYSKPLPSNQFMKLLKQ